MTRKAVACGLFLALAVASPARAGWLAPHTFAISHEPHEQGGTVATANGRAIVASHRFDGLSDVVEVSERAGPTASWQPPRRLTPLGANAHYPEVALDDAGNAIVLWTLTYSEFDEVVQASVRIGPGGSWSAPVQISPPGEWSELGKIAFDDQGNATAVWANITHHVVQANMWNASTRRWSAPMTLSSGEIRSGPLLAVSPSGRAVAAWSSPTRNGNVILRAAIRPSPTAPWLAEQDLSQPDGYASVNDIAEHPSGRTIVMWDRFRATTDYVEVATLPAGSLVWGPPETLNRAGTSGYNGDVEIDQQGAAVAAWQRNIDLRQVGIDVSIRGPSDTHWSTPEPIAESAFIPKVAVDADGNVIVAFSEVAWFTTIEARMRDAVTGTWGPVAKLSQSVFEAYAADIGVNSIGGVFALWQLHSDQCYCFILQGADYLRGPYGQWRLSSPTHLSRPAPPSIESLPGPPFRSSLPAPPKS